MIETLDPLDKGRKCFRMIGGVLTQRTVGDVLPALQQNQEGVSLKVIFFLFLFSVFIFCFRFLFLFYFLFLTAKSQKDQNYTGWVGERV